VSVGAGASTVGTTLERRYLSGTFAELCRVASPSGSERRCAERVIAELRAIGVDVHEDDAGERAGSECGNLLARIPARAPDGRQLANGEDPPKLLLCAHLDTVPLQAPLEPVLRDGFWENDGEGILGADNKAAVVVMLALARHIVQHGSPVELELLFTVCEEVALAGARAFDVSLLRSDYGYTFDHASPIGEVILDSPTHFRIEASFRGAAAHAGLHPELGSSAILAAAHAVASIPHGRVDEHSTVNVGTIAGGSAINVVAEHCRLVAEVRSIDGQRAETLVAELVDRIHEAANRPECSCDVDVSVERTFTGYRLKQSDHPVRVAEAALRACGHTPIWISSGGGADTNALIAQGFSTVNLANGTERAHEPGERVSVAALEQMFDVALALLEQSVALSRDAAL
jgi:tripeptide aminopeptidase